MLLRRFALTQNRSLDGVLHKLNSKAIKDGVADHEVEVDSDLEEDAYHVRNKADDSLPGAKRQNNAQIIKRSTKLAIRVKQCKFSPDGSQFACATTEGLMIYSLAQDMPSQSMMFRPYDLDEDVTIENIIGNLQQSNYLSALLLALRMNEPVVLDKVFKCIPLASVALISANIPSSFVFRFMAFLQG